MMTEKNLEKLFKELKIDKNQIKWTEYKNCFAFYNEYWKIVMKHIRKKKPRKVILFFLESVGENLDNNMFSNGSKPIVVPYDSYLWNIYRGFFPGTPKPKSKGSALKELLQFQCNGENVPVIILDLFPFHGMDLKDHRSKIVNGFAINQKVKDLILNDVNGFLKELSDTEPKLEKYFLFGVPYSIWNGLGGAGPGSLYMDGFDKKEGPLGTFINKHAIRNVGGYNISNNNIVNWRKQEGLD